MVGAPLPSSGNQAQPFSAMGNMSENSESTNKYATPPQQALYATPNATISTLLPYNGLPPSAYSASSLPKPSSLTTPAMPNTPYNTYPPNPVAHNSHYSTYQPNPSSVYPSAPPTPYPQSSAPYPPQPVPPPYSQCPAYPPTLAPYSQSIGYPPHQHQTSPPAGYPAHPPPGAPSGYPSMGVYPPPPPAANATYPPRPY